MGKISWILCPICKNKTRLKVREDTILENFPLFCPKCRQETLINVEQQNISVVKEPDAKTLEPIIVENVTIIGSLFF
ncbi:conjugal transfer protein [Paenibacillus campinasensis]|uniref:Conjugal transfer protein n=1 Tax=Paenibacillus campinasensis TaxID=66347 RepID=A0ABW9SUQ8_9BACL|nr:cysteine-rich KTR domain-containing protein [Paenibacillus campinasensis]MUG64720.1 conjugal transfer protein [Paenibacillus campinasensis]